MYLGQENVEQLNESVNESGGFTDKISPDKIASLVEEYRKNQARRLSSVYIGGPLMLWYGYKGKIGKIGRVALVLMGASAIYTNYSDWKKANEFNEEASYLKDFVSNIAKGNDESQS